MKVKQFTSLMEWITTLILYTMIASILMMCITRDRGAARGSELYIFELTEPFRLGDESSGDILLFGRMRNLLLLTNPGGFS